jgi:hypothetical protein
LVIEVIDRAIDTEDEPATVCEFDFMSLESAAAWGVPPRALPPRELVIHRGLLSRAESDNKSQRSTVRSARWGPSLSR